MNPFLLTAWCLIAVIITAVLPYLIGKRAIARKTKDAIVHDAYADFWHDEPESPALKAARDKFAANPYDASAHEAFRGEAYRDGGTIIPRDASRSARRTAVSAALGASYGTGRAVFDKHGHRVRTPSIFLTAEMLTAVNTKRKIIGKPPLNRDGFRAAASVASRSTNQPIDNHEWLTYLIMYEVFEANHTQPGIGADTGISITPDAPFNGHGGEFAGAGASGDWSTPAALTLGAAGLDPGVGDAVDKHFGSVTITAPADPLSDPASFKGASDPASLPSTPSVPDAAPSAPSPSYSAPDTSSSYTSSDSGSSYSSDTGGGGGGGDGS
jgi:hypothetical protein